MAKRNTIFLFLFSLVYNPLKKKIIVFSVPQNEAFIFTQGAGPLSLMLHRHVSIVAQNGQTKHWLREGFL